ncbi:ABC transporter substrate-binding protein [Streptacidiphilus sp. P02-A3a]|uniref:peptide ABC transporter substrate-binding protein n=1 Tax=Streptacidiphilus sp. P02-A3a TaxID=2704468 RepID=UPI0015FCB23E|nr:ABC transporter substrate-binding protein [Streptacidiphilus sp. P02-A3a]QMU67701.1 ABC transporter substrate-binding protein [Streptacidiphilus sp. P02-A3a]
MRGATRAKFVVGAISIALAATACSSGSSSSSGGSSGNGVVSALWGIPQNSLMPGNTNEINGSKVIQNILTGLISYDPKTNAPVKENEDSITTTDQQNFTVKIKPNLKFSDGTPVTASSYVDAWNYAALSTNKQLNGSYFDIVQGYPAVAPATGNPTATTMSGLKVVNDTTFTVALTAKNSTWPQSLGFLGFDPLPTSFFKDPAAWAKNPIGNGPYKISSYTVNQEMDLVPNPEYTGAQTAQNKGLALKVYTDPTAAYADLQSGKLDVDDTIPTSDLPNVKSDLNGRFINTPSGTTAYIGFPLYRADWSTANARQVRVGLSMAIDRATISQKIFNSTVTPATEFTNPVLGDAGGYKANLCGSSCDYNPTKAKQLIDSAGGLPGGQMSIAYNSDGGNADWVNAVCNSINNALSNNNACVGKPTTNFADLRNQITNKQVTSAFRTAWSMDWPLAVDFLQPLFSTNGAANDSHYSNAHFDSLINQANSASSTTAANTLLQQAEAQLVTDMPNIPLWYSNSTAGYSANVSNVQMDGFKVPVYWAVKK